MRGKDSCSTSRTLREPQQRSGGPACSPSLPESTLPVSPSLTLLLAPLARGCDLGSPGALDTLRLLLSPSTAPLPDLQHRHSQARPIVQVSQPDSLTQSTQHAFTVIYGPDFELPPRTATPWQSTCHSAGSQWTCKTAPSHLNKLILFIPGHKADI